MYRVLLVDDELWSLEGIYKLLEWEKMGFRVIAQVTDASEAWEIIRSSTPDVVFTDIRMPEISGIELLNMSREMGSTSEFVVISGFAEFEYAQEALRNGAFDYQLKPIDPDDAKLLLEKLKGHLDRKQSAANIGLLEQLSSGSHHPLDILKTRGVVPCGKYWQAAVISGESSLSSDEAASFFGDLSCLSLSIGEEKTVVILNGSKPLDGETLSELALWAKRKNARAGISSVSEEAACLARLIREADMAALSGRFIQGKPEVSRFTAGGSASIESAAAKAEKWMLAKSYAEISRVLDGIPALFVQEDLGIYHAALLWNRMVVVIGKRLESCSPAETMDFLDYEDILHRFKDLSEMCEYIRELFKKICCCTDHGSVKGHHGNDHFMSLLEYVNKHFNTDLSLSELSEKFFLNMSYCSELFKKVTGYTFTDYVTKLRMETAAELLQSGTYTAEKVHLMTGYHDYYYFSKIFKKYHGVPPSQFLGRMTMHPRPV